jgi:putative flavoprotein involved in K+ transport
MIDCVVVGAGQAGLSMSYCLTEYGVEHVVLERGDVAERWRTERWDSLRLLTPNWSTQLPGFHYAGPEPDGFDSRDEYVAYLERYARSFAAPIRSHTAVTRVRAADDGSFEVHTSGGMLKARNVVAATGPFTEPMIPEESRSLPKDIDQIHSSQYRNPQQLPPGAVLVIGSRNSGLQIVEELLSAGRKVFVSVGSLGGMPRRYRGRDAVRWLLDLGALDTPVEDAEEEMKRTPPPMLSGVDGGHDLNLRHMADRGAVFFGRFLDVHGNRVRFSEGLPDVLRASAESYRKFRARIDEFIAAHGILAPDDSTPCGDADLIPAVTGPATDLDLREAGITSVVWCTGFRLAYPWIDIPVFNEEGVPLHERGISSHQGLYFLGLRWLSKYKSFFIYGVGEDAERLAGVIAARRP